MRNPPGAANRAMGGASHGVFMLRGAGGKRKGPLAARLEGWFYTE